MDASLSPRTRLQPGVPAGGIAAVAVVVGMTVLGMALGVEDSEHVRIAIDRHITAVPTPPVPPAIGRVPAVGGVVDLPAIRSAAGALADEAAKMAVAKAEAFKGESRGVQTLDRAKMDGGVNRYTGFAVAPSGLRLADVVGTATITVDDKANGITFTMVNSRQRYGLDVNDGVLWITGPGASNPGVPVELAITVPPGTPLLINSLSGDIKVDGDLEAPVRMDVLNGSVSIASATSARIRVSQSGKVDIGTVDDLAAVQIPGAGDVTIGNAGRASVEIPGTGTVQIGNVDDGMIVALPGKGDVSVGNLDGPFQAAFQGVGTISVAGGSGDPVSIGVTGPGQVRFAGTAHDPSLLLTGTGAITIDAVDGKPSIHRTGSGTIVLNGRPAD